MKTAWPFSAPSLAKAVIVSQENPKEKPREADAALTELAQLKQMGIPLGWKSCPDGVCLWPDSGEKLKNTLVWIFQVGLTGILIGLGAPFWFDVAKRLSQIRKGAQSESASKEFRFSQSNANGDAGRRREIIDQVLTDAAMEAVHLA